MRTAAHPVGIDIVGLTAHCQGTCLVEVAWELYLGRQGVAVFGSVHRGSGTTCLLGGFARLYGGARHYAVPDKVLVDTGLYHADEVVAMDGSVVIQACGDIATRGLDDDLRTADGITFGVGTGTHKESHKGKGKGEDLLFHIGKRKREYYNRNFNRKKAARMYMPTVTFL